MSARELRRPRENRMRESGCRLDMGTRVLLGECGVMLAKLDTAIAANVRKKRLALLILLSKNTQHVA